MFLKLTKNKGLWIALRWIKWDHSYFEINCKFSKKTDHAGLRVWFSIHRVAFELEITDHRHWNVDLNCWEHHE